MIKKQTLHKELTSKKTYFHKIFIGFTVFPRKLQNPFISVSEIQHFVTKSWCFDFFIEKTWQFWSKNRCATVHKWRAIFTIFFGNKFSNHRGLERKNASWRKNIEFHEGQLILSCFHTETYQYRSRIGFIASEILDKCVLRLEITWNQ